MILCVRTQMQEIGAEIERLRAENKELCHMLRMMNDKYTALKTHVEKIREEMDFLNESCSSHYLIKRQPFESSKPKSTRIFVRTSEDGSSLVSLLEHVLLPSDHAFFSVWNLFSPYVHGVYKLFVANNNRWSRMGTTGESMDRRSLKTIHLLVLILGVLWLQNVMLRRRFSSKLPALIASFFMWSFNFSEFFWV